MSVILSVLIVVLSMLINFCLQLIPGTFALFYHYALGKTSAKKADDRSLSFIMGVEIFVTVIWLLAYFTVIAIFYNDNPIIKSVFFYTLAGIFIIESIFSLFFYYRKGRSTALFIPRKVAAGISTHAKKAKNRSDCILLGALSGFFELIFTLPLLFVCSSILMNFDTTLRVILITIYIILSILPLFIIHAAFHSGRNLADIQRFRVKIKPLIRIILSFSFLTIALSAIYLGAING